MTSWPGCAASRGTRRVGHAGTLDPMATGVLVLGVDRGTKLLTFLVGCDKSYAATIRLGQSTITDDAEGETTALLGVPDARALEAELPAAVARLTGAIEQVPSSVSAIKVGGVRSYARVRAGDDVVLPARPVTVSRFDVHAVRPASDPGRGRPAGRRRRRRRGGRRVVGHLRAGPRPRPRRPPRGRRSPHGAATHPGRPLRPRAGPHARGSSPRRRSATDATAYPCCRSPRRPAPSCPCTR